MIRKIDALLPMKGHSERIPNKNMKVFADKPLYHAVMQSLLKSKYINNVVVNTDSEIIANDVQKNFNRVLIHRRPEEIIGDDVSMNKIVAFDLDRLKGEHFLQTHSTNPLIHPETIDKAIESYFNNLHEYDSLFSVTKLQTRLYWQDGTAINHNPKELKRTQDLPIVYEENSNLYIFSESSFMNASENRIGLTPQMYHIDKLEGIDIDESDDWTVAELLYVNRFDKKLL